VSLHLSGEAKAAGPAPQRAVLNFCDHRWSGAELRVNANKEVGEAVGQRRCVSRWTLAPASTYTDRSGRREMHRTFFGSRVNRYGVSEGAKRATCDGRIK